MSHSNKLDGLEDDTKVT